MNSSNADSMMIINSIDLSQKDSDTKSKYSCNDEMNIISILNLLTQILILKKKEQRSFMKRSDLEADSTSLKHFRKKD